MKRDQFFGVVLGFLALSSAAHAAPGERFGLTPEQRKALLAATGGLVNFDAVPRLRAARQPAPYPGFFTQTKSSEGVEREGDPEFENEWWVKNLRVVEAWKLATGKGVRVADCDAGYFHEESDLQSTLLMDLRQDFADLQNPLKINDGGYVYHGTAVAALVAGKRDGIGTNGIAFESEFVPLQNYNYDSTLDDKDKEAATAECILGALKMPGVRSIILENQTWDGSSETDPAVREAVRLALNAGVLIVSAGGNAGVELKKELADDTGSLIIGALKTNGEVASFSNWGSRVAVATYGEQIKTLYGPGGAYGQFGGTSGATGLMGGMTALILEANPTLSPAQVKEILIRTRKESPTTAKVGGEVNLIKALEAAKATPQDSKGLAQRMDRQELIRAILLDK